MPGKIHFHFFPQRSQRIDFGANGMCTHWFWCADRNMRPSQPSPEKTVMTQPASLWYVKVLSVQFWHSFSPRLKFSETPQTPMTKPFAAVAMAARTARDKVVFIVSVCWVAESR